jgi:hypothetical protein
MRVSTQVRLVQWSLGGATLLMAVNVALTAAALIHLDRQHFRMVTEQQLAQVHTDLYNTLVVASFSVIVLAVVFGFLFRPSAKVRLAVWTVAPLIGLATLCFLVGGPEWAVAPTGEEPELVRAEYAQAVPDWYTVSHGIAGLLSAGLLFFLAVWISRVDLREYYMDAGFDPNRPYTSWVERTGGP